MKRKKLLILTVATVLMAAIFATFMLSGCAKDEEKKGNYLQEDATFKLIDDDVDKQCSVMGIKVLTISVMHLALDKENTQLYLGKDGTFKLTLMIEPEILKVLNGDENSPMVKILSGLGIDLSGVLSSVDSVDLKTQAEYYAVPIMPGFTTEKVEESFGLLQSLDARFVGLDFEDENVKKMVQSVQETGRLNTDLVLPTTLGVEICSTYEVVEITDADGNVHTTIQVAGDPQTKESFLIFNVTTNPETGKRELYLRVEFLQMDIYLAE